MAFSQSFCYPCFLNDSITLPELFSHAKNVGYEAMELWFRDEGFDALVRTAGDAGLKVASMCGHTSLEGGMNNPREHPRILAELRASIDLAADLGIPGLITFSGKKLEGRTTQQGIDACVDCLRQIAPYAENKGVNLNMELLNSKVNHPGYECDHTAFGVAICQAVNSPRVKLLYDIYHMQIMEGDCIRTIQDNIQWIGHFHTAGNPGRQDLDDDQELNYRGICKAIDATGYDLYLAHEFRPKGDPLAALAKAHEICHVRQG